MVYPGKGIGVNLSQLYYFNKLAELEHYTNAAKELYITQPALSDAIHALEHELGVPLFQKVGRNVKLTRYGREFNEYVTEALRQLDKGVAIAKSYTKELSGEIKIGAIFTVQGDYLPALLGAYGKDVTSLVKFELFQGFTLPLVEGLRAELYDIVFAAKPNDTSGLILKKVVSHQLVAFVSKESPIADRESISLEDLDGLNVLTYRRGTPIGEEVEEELSKAHLKATQNFEDEITLGGMVASDSSLVGLGTLSIGLKSYQNLRIIPIEGVRCDFHDIYLIHRDEEFQSYALESFIEYAKSYVPPKGVIPTTDVLCY